MSAVAVLDNAEVRILIHALREPLNALTRDVAALDSAHLPPSIEPIAKSIQAGVDRVLIALEEVESALEDGGPKRQRPRGR